MKYNEVSRLINDVNYVFITRTSAKPFSDAEIDGYIKEKKIEEEYSFRIKDGVKQIFLSDMSTFGPDFCTTKYGASRSDILREARRLAPNHNNWRG